MRMLVQERGHDRIIKRGTASLYDTVARLTKAGLVEAHESARSGRRPERTVYRITPEGLAELQRWVREALAEPSRTEEFPAALSFMCVLPKKEVVALLERRVGALAALIERADEALASAAGAGVSSVFLSEERYSQCLRHAERDWISQFAGQLRSGELRWPQPTRK
jgi:DNA-binding PadR family transcriptional regulator